MGLLYVSNGNIPSRWAHTVQTMKMCEALSTLVPSFRLLIASDARGLLSPTREIFRWYGISRPFRVRRLPIGWRVPREILEKPDNQAFHLPAVRYVRLTRPKLVYTRCHEVARQCLHHGFRTVFEVHSNNEKAQRYLRAFGRSPFLAGLVTTSEILADAFAEAGAPRECIMVHPNGVDLERFRDLESERDRRRRSLGIEQERFLVVYVGSLYPYKGIATVLEAAGHLPEFRFLLLGGSDDQITKWRGRFPDLENVRYRSFVPNAEVPSYLAASDACLVPNSASDRTADFTYSLKLYEYMAAGRPVVASAFPSLRSVIGEGDAGILVPPDDAKAVADALVRLREDPSLCQRLSTEGRRRAAEASWGERARALLSRFAPDLLKAPNRPPTP